MALAATLLVAAALEAMALLLQAVLAWNRNTRACPVLTQKAATDTAQQQVQRTQATVVVGALLQVMALLVVAES
jgi:hypothetical protein